MSIRGRYQNLRRGYARDVADGKAAASPDKALAVGALLVDEGDLDRAKVVFQRLVDAGDPPWAAYAASYLGQILERWGDRAGAVAAYRVAVTMDDAQGRALCAHNLGLLVAARDVGAAREAFQTAVAARHPEHSVASAFRLGILEQHHGDLAEAQKWLRQAADSPHPAWSARAAGTLALLLEEQGDHAGAVALMTRAAASEDPASAASALLWLADEAETADPPRAERLYRQAVAICAEEAAEDTAEAAYYLGKIVYGKGDRREARVLFTRAHRAERPAVAARGMLGLGILHADDGDVAGAAEWYRKAEATGDEETVTSAKKLLGDLPN